MFDVDLNLTQLQILHHPRYAEQAGLLKTLLPLEELQDHFVVFSSGTTSRGLKGYALSKLALAKNANAVNNHFKLGPHERWGLSIPTYHVGGLSVLVRAELGNQEVIDCRGWEPESWTKKVTQEKVTVTTVVPTQVYDLIQAKLKSPDNLRFMIVGGDFLSSELERQARELGWPIIRTYGMSEVCSQLASARTAGGDLEILPIHKVKIDEAGRLLVKSDSLFTIQFRLNETLDIIQAMDLCDEEAFYITQDRALITGKSIIPQGRLDDHFKMGGHLIDFLSLKDQFSTYLLGRNLYQKAELVIEENEREGKQLGILALSNTFTEMDKKKFSELILPLKISTLKFCESFERTDLGKLKK